MEALEEAKASKERRELAVSEALTEGMSLLFG